MGGTKVLGVLRKASNREASQVRLGCGGESLDREADEDVAALRPLALPLVVLREAPRAPAVAARLRLERVREICSRPRTARRGENNQVKLSSEDSIEPRSLGRLVHEIVVRAADKDVDFEHQKAVPRSHALRLQGFGQRGLSLHAGEEVGHT